MGPPQGLSFPRPTGCWPRPRTRRPACRPRSPRGRPLRPAAGQAPPPCRQVYFKSCIFRTSTRAGFRVPRSWLRVRRQPHRPASLSLTWEDALRPCLRFGRRSGGSGAGKSRVEMGRKPASARKLRVERHACPRHQGHAKNRHTAMGPPHPHPGRSEKGTPKASGGLHPDPLLPAAGAEDV